jgi:hypothetical protein
VDYSPLRTWLGLAPGSWPPDHYTLLGLAPGRCDLATVEPRVLARMALLRPHQLLHPELVTEGMNRLAQALICLTDPAARAAYDAEHGFATAPAPAIPPQPPPVTGPEVASILAEPGEPESVVPDPTLLLEYPLSPGMEPPEPLPPPYEVVEEEPDGPLLPYEVVWEEDVSPPVPAYEVVAPTEVVEAELVAPPDRPWQPATRRQLFARLALLRRFLAAWRTLQPFVADPREPLARPARVLGFLEAVTQVRPLLASLPGLVGDSGRSGELVAIALRQPHVLHTFRTLLPDQRRTVAIDWRRAELAVQREYTRLRELDRTGRPRQRRWSRRGRLVRWAARNPESLLVAAAIIALLSAALRARGGP